jgi:hypothetical protein
MISVKEADGGKKCGREFAKLLVLTREDFRIELRKEDILVDEKEG